jgi:hypothetical protein
VVWWFGGLVVWWFGGLVVWWFGGLSYLFFLIIRIPNQNKIGSSNSSTPIRRTT